MNRTDEEAQIDAEMSSREQRLDDLLGEGKVSEALREVESWAFWPLDDIGLWLLIEAFYQSRRRDCVPVLERLLRDETGRDDLSLRHMQEMLEAAREWP